MEPHTILIALSFMAFTALSDASDYGNGLKNFAPSKLLENNGQLDHWKAIGRIKSEGNLDCTATLIDTRSPTSLADAPAYLLTSGHCTLMKYGVMGTDLPINGSVTFNYFSNTVATQQAYPLKRILWSSMQGADLALVELQAPLQTLINDGINPIRLAEQTPEPGSDMLIVGAPFGFKEDYLRLAACVQQKADDVFEGRWVWRNTIRNQCTDIRPGSSGSPMLTRDSNELFGVVNTTFQTNVREKLVERSSQDYNYGNDVSFLHRCFVNGVLDPVPERCELFPTFSMAFAWNALPKQYAKIKRDDQGGKIYPHWDIRFSGDKPFYRYSSVRTPKECESPDHYSSAIPANDAVINDEIGPHTGVNLLCMLGVDSPDQRPSRGLMRNVLVVALELQDASPPAMPDMSITPSHGGSYKVKWNHNPRIFSQYTHKYGAPSTTDCNDPAGYTQVLRDRTIPARLLPMKICTYAYDVADQPAPVREDLLETHPDLLPSTPEKPATTIIRTLSLQD